MNCKDCGYPLEDGQATCAQCGANIEFTEKRFCQKCGAPLSPNDRFCSICGTAAHGGTKSCASCGQVIPEHSDFCPQCGRAVEKGDVAEYTLKATINKALATLKEKQGTACATSTKMSERVLSSIGIKRVALALVFIFIFIFLHVNTYQLQIKQNIRGDVEYYKYEMSIANPDKNMYLTEKITDNDDGGFAVLGGFAGFLLNFVWLLIGLVFVLEPIYTNSLAKRKPIFEWYLLSCTLLFTFIVPLITKSCASHVERFEIITVERTIGYFLLLTLCAVGFYLTLSIKKERDKLYSSRLCPNT